MELEELRASHSLEMMKQMCSLYQHQILTDVILSVSDRTFKAHAVVLVAFSSYFKSVLENREEPNVIEFQLENVSPACMEMILEYLYTGELSLTTDTVADVLTLAERLDVTCVTEKCQEFTSHLINSTSLTNDETDGELAQKPPSALPDEEEKLEIEKTETREKRTDLDLENVPGSDNLETVERNVTDQRSSQLKFEATDKTSDIETTSTDSILFCRRSKRKRPSNDVEITSAKGLKQKRESQRIAQKVTSGITISSKRASSNLLAKRTNKLQRQVKKTKSSATTQSVDARAKCNVTRRTRGKKSQAVITSLPDTIEMISGSDNEDEAVFKCCLCEGEVLHGKLALKVHLLFHTGPETPEDIAHSCRHCGRNFANLQQYNRHLTSHGLTEEDRYLEHTDQDKLPLFNTRVVGPRSRDVVFKCEECDHLGLSNALLKKHMQLQHGNIRHACPHCSLTHVVRFTHERHILLKHSTRRHMCDVCGEGFVKRTSVMRHKHSKHNIKESAMELHPCTEPDCKFVGYLPSMLKKHTQAVHRNSREICHICGKAFTTKHYMNQHIKIAHDNIRSFKCSKCSEFLPCSITLTRHLASRHGVKPLHCHLCDYSTHCSYRLKRHKYNSHKIKSDKKLQIYQCDQCSYSTITPYQLSMHHVSHNKELNVPCTQPDCTKKFRSKRHLQEHLRGFHRPPSYNCNFCTYSSTKSDKVKTHIRTRHTHIKYKPFKCPYCDFTCATSGNCRKHVKRKHPKECVKYFKTGETTPAAVKELKVNKAVASDQIRDTQIQGVAEETSGDENLVHSSER